MSATRNPIPVKSANQSIIDKPTAARFGTLDRKSGEWRGRPQQLGSDEVILDPQQPKDTSKVARILTGVLSLRQSNKISDAAVVAASRWHADWSRGTGHPLRASEARFLGVSLGGAASSDGIPCGQLDAATRHRQAAQAVGKKSTERLLAYICLDLSLKAAAAILGVSRQDLGGALISDLERLVEHYHEVDSGKLARDRQRTADRIAKQGTGKPSASRGATK